METQRAYHERRYGFGEQLLKLRSRVSLTQIELAEQIGVHRRTLQNWESGAAYPKAEALERLIAALLRHHAFAPTHEQDEALALWELARQDGSRPLSVFDHAWFARILAVATTVPTTPQPQAGTARVLIDWGEALAAPTLYGREDALSTLHQWVILDQCRVISIVGIGGMGKSSLAIAFAQRSLAAFELVLFRSLQNGPPLAGLLDQTIRAIADQGTLPPSALPEKIAHLVLLLRQRRCLLILDNLETIMQPGALTGVYRTGYADYGPLLHALSEGEHQSCLILTSREKPAELGPLEGHSAPVRSLQLMGLDDTACALILSEKGITATSTEVCALSSLYSGSPLALKLVAEPIRELFGGDVSAFLAMGDAFFNGMGKLLEQQIARSTPLEQTIVYWLAIERELVPLRALLANLSTAVPQRAVLVALESLRRRVLIEHGPNQPAFTVQPVIREFLTDQLVQIVCQELIDAQPRLLRSHALVQASAAEYVRRSQEQLIATPLLERLVIDCGSASAAEHRLLAMLPFWRDHPLAEHGYGPGNIVNLLRLLRGNVCGLNLADLAIRQAYLQGVELQDTSLAGTTIQDSRFTETFDVVTAVAISSTGEYWAAASRRGEVRVWAADGLTLHRVWRAHTDMVWALTFSPDGHALATGSWDGSIKLWDVASGALLWQGGHTSHTNRLVFAPDGSMLASSGNDATTRLWDRKTGTLLQTLAHPAPVPAISWGPDGQLLASGDLAGHIRLWLIPQNEPATCIQTLVEHATYVDGLAFAPDGRTLASASWDGTVKLWDISTIRPRARPRSGPTGPPNSNAGMVGARLRQTLTGHTDRVLRVAWSPDGRTLASSSRDQTIWLWDVEQASYRMALRGYTAGVNGLAFTPNSRSLLGSSEDGTLRVWDVTSGQVMRVMQGYAASFYDVGWSPDCTQLVTGGTDYLVTTYAVAGETPPRVLTGHKGVVFGVGWSADGRMLASSEWDNAIRLWDARSGVCLEVIEHPDDPGNYFYGLAWSPDGQRLASGTYRRGVLVWDVNANRPQWIEPGFPTWIRHVAWSPDGAHVAGGGDNGIVYIWDTTAGILRQQLARHSNMVTRVAWSPDGTQLASGSGSSAGGELFVWNAEQGERMRAFAAHPGIIYAVAWGSSAQLVISGDGYGHLRWWDVQSGVCIHMQAAHQGTIQSLQRSPDGTTLASCGDDGAIKLWDLHSGAYLQTLRRDRPYERLVITGINGLTEVQKESLIALGAINDIGTQGLASTERARNRA